MEKREAEKNWDSFWASGRIDDYLSYRNSVSSGNRDGANNHAHIGI